MAETLERALFPDDGEHCYAVIDGASCEDLLEKLDRFQPEYACLYAGELAADVQEVAPYLVGLLPRHPFTIWMLSNCSGKNWGIFARSPANLRIVRKHLRTILLVKDPDDKTLYFRYYDPRVLRIFLPTCEPAELAMIFGPISSYLLEDGEGEPQSFSAHLHDHSKVWK